MARTYLVTGTASGIGKATRTLLEEQGARVVGADLRDAEVIADLSTPAGRVALVDGTRAILGDTLDAVISCAGVGGDTGFSGEMVVRVNYFGAVATLRDLRPLLAGGNAPRAAVIASVAILGKPVETLMNACLTGDEEAAVLCAGPEWGPAYSTTKRALARWVRRQATTPEWAGAGIALNAVAPGAVVTGQTASYLGTPEGQAESLKHMPQPFGGIGEPRYVASLLAWLTSPDNRFVCGQVVFVDGGFDAVARGDDIW